MPQLFQPKKSKIDKTDGQTTNRFFWGKTNLPLPPLNLIQIQKDSYAKFLEKGIRDVLNEVSPIEDFTGKNWRLEFGDYSIGEPKYTPLEAIDKEVTFEHPIKVKATLTNKQAGTSQTQEVFLGEVPAMTEKGTFVVNGIERVVVSQLVRSPGVFFSGEVDPITGKMLYSAELRPVRGSWLEFTINRQDVMTVKIDRRRKFAITTLLRALGLSNDEQISKILSEIDTFPDHHYLTNTLIKDSTKSQDEALMEIYRKMRPGEPVVLDNARALIEAMFFNARRYHLGKIGRYKINKKLKLNVANTEENWTIKLDDIIATIKYLAGLANGVGEVDDIDHLANRRVRMVGELVQQLAFRTGILRLERVIRERMSYTPLGNELTATGLVNARPVISVINEFFRSSQLSAILDQTNPLSEVDNLRRLSVMGTGGITRERASFSIRDINHSQYGRIDPIRSPEGPNIGLVTYLALYARVNDYGFLETPYRKIEKVKKWGGDKYRVTDEIAYLTADDEENYYITHAEIPIDDEGFIKEDRVPVRYKGEFFVSDTANVSFMDLVARQVVGTSASLIPFLSHDEANRALMGTHMQCQAVPLLIPNSPVVGTGMEGLVAESMGRVVRAEDGGKVTISEATRVQVEYGQGAKKKIVEYPVRKFVRTSQSTCFSQKPQVKTGQRVKKGDLLVDGPSTQDGELALGQNLTIAYMSYDGLGYEDAIVISDRLVKQDLLTSIHIEEYESAVVDTKLGPEEITRDIPSVGEEALANLDENGIVVIGAQVRPGDILVGKIAPKGETELTAEERLLRAIFGEKAREVRDTSLRVPHGERGTVIDVRILDREKGDDLEPGTNKLIKVKVAQMRKVLVGDKLAGRHGNKGIISKIVSVYDMPYMADGTPVDIIISPLSIISRMNLGQLLEAHLGIAAQKLGYKVAVPVFEEASEKMIIEELEKASLPVSGKIVLYDGRTGQPLENEVVVGVGYIMKLIHMVEDKQHARSTGPYSLVTQQPLGGKAQMGGQRLGEMEVWALEAYGAAAVLQEMLTIKSDDVVGRSKAFEAIIKGIDIPQAMVPESFKVLVKELQSLCLDIIPIGAKVAAQKVPTEQELKQEAKVGEQVKEMEQALGAVSVAQSAEVLAPEGFMEVEEVKPVLEKGQEE